jgi:hypothetical protein
MAYDTATRTIVLFGGFGPPPYGYLSDTWTWNGVGWVRQHPTASPLGRNGMTVVYDGATRAVVLFGACTGSVVSTVAVPWAEALLMRRSMRAQATSSSPVTLATSPNRPTER